MKHTYTILALLALLLVMGLQTVRAQVPARISYQGLLLDQDKALLADGDHQVTFRLYDQLEGGEVLWSETQTVALEDGLLATMIGAREALELAFDRPYFLSVQLDDQSESQRVALAASAYALMARDVPDGTVVRSISGLRDAVELVAGDGIAIRRQDNRLVISATGALKGFGIDEAPGAAPAEAGIGYLTDEEMDEYLETLGPGGTNTGLDAAYDGGRIITLDDGRVILQGTIFNQALEVRNADMLFRDATGGAAAFRFQVDGVSPLQIWQMVLNGPSGAMKFVNSTSGTTPFQMLKGAPNNLLRLTGSGAKVGGTMAFLNGSGVETITINGDVGGDGRVTTQELEITGGSDLSERFEVSGNFGVPVAAPGMVVSIDPAHPGALTLSGRAYDRMVAGVVSGAGGIETGLLMGQEGSVADGAVPVALTGRVYVWVDAGHGAVQAGDLLTSSTTPGHAMKVTDYARSQGAILGKAMTGLSEGRGLVLMLVSLQ